MPAHVRPPPRAAPLERDSVEPQLERSEARFLGNPTLSRDARFARASSVGKWGSTESHPAVFRRQALRVAALGISAPLFMRAAAPQPKHPHGVVSGEPTAERIGAQILASGGNAVDAMVAAALAGAVGAPPQTGIGDYGASIILASADGKRVIPRSFEWVSQARSARGRR